MSIKKVFNTKNAALAMMNFIDSEADKINNQVGYIYDNIDSLDFGANTDTSQPVAKTIEALPSDFPLAYENAVRLYTTAPLTNFTRIGVKTFHEYKALKNGKIKLSFWVEQYSTAYQYNIGLGVGIVYYRGLAPSVTKSINCVIPTRTLVDTAIPAIDAGGVYNESFTDYDITINDYVTYGGVNYFNIQAEITTDIAQSDFFEISWNALGVTNFAGGESPDILTFGHTVVDFDEEINYNIDSSFITQIKNKLSNQEDNYVDSYVLDNKIIDIMENSGLVKYASTEDFSNTHNGKITSEQTDITTSVVYDELFNKKYTVTKNTGNLEKFVSSVTPKSVMTFTPPVTDSDTLKDEGTLSFWIKRSELNGNGIIFTNGSGGTWLLTQAHLLAEGFVKTRWESGTDYQELRVNSVDGDYTHITIKYNADISIYYFIRVSIYDLGSDVSTISLYNPTFIYSDNVNPYHYYKSLSEKKESELRGKNAVLIGDSQYNNGIVASRVAKDLGVNIFDAHFGGHSMKIRSSQLASPTYQSFYHYDLRSNVLGLADIDLYIITASTNDGSGGGVATEASVNYVLNNYPVYGDDAGTIAAKQALFDALSNQDVDDNFTYMACYAAYLKQIYENNPDSKVIICSVPISAIGLLTGNEVDGHGEWDVGEDADTARTAYEATYDAINSENLTLSKRYNTYYADFEKKCGMSFENFIYKSIDGTHWLDNVSEATASTLIKEIKGIDL